MISVVYSAEHSKTFKDIGTVLREFRQRRQMSQNELAEISGVSTGHISRIENGSKAPSIELLDKLFLALHLQIRIEDVMEKKQCKTAQE